VRSPSEFAQDHVPGAQNWPVLSDDERHIVGTLPSRTRCRPAGRAAWWRAMSRGCWTSARPTSQQWRPLVYCWRGGQRSPSLHWFLGQIGFRSRQLVGATRPTAELRADWSSARRPQWRCCAA
jgi:tRNA 2-selenouridine synthase